MSSTSTQTIFSRAVKHHLHDGFVSLLDRIDEFNLGAVFTYHEKPHAWMFWRRKELDFTGAQLSDLMAKADGSDEAGLVFKSETKTLFDATSDSSQRTVNIDLDLDGEVKAAVVDLGGDVGGSGKKIVKITVALGSFDHITSNMYEAVEGSKLTADLKHPIIQEAMDKGRTLFVISSIYQSDKVDISVSREEDASVKAKEKLGDESTDTTAKTDKPTDTTAKTDPTDGTGTTTGDTTTSSSGEATASGVESAIEKVVGKAENVGKDLVTQGMGIPEGEESASGDASAKTTGITVTKRDRPSNIGFSVLRLEIQKDGSLSPQARIGVSFDHKIHASYSDAFLASSGATAGDDSSNQRGLEPPSTPPKEDGKDTPKQEEDGKDTPKEEGSKDTPQEDSKDTPKEDGKDTPKDKEDEHAANDKDGAATD